MRRDTRRYKPLFKEYEEMLRALVKQGEIQCNTAERRLSHASRILEACVRGMPLDSLYDLAPKKWTPC